MRTLLNVPSRAFTCKNLWRQYCSAEEREGTFSDYCVIAKADHWPWEKKKFYHQFSVVKYSYLPTDTFRKYVEMHVTRSKLTLKFTGYCRQTSYTDSTVIHTLVPAVAWELQSQFAPGYMHFNIIFWRCLWEDMNISQWKNGDRTFFLSRSTIGFCYWPGLGRAGHVRGLWREWPGRGATSHIL